MDPLPRQPSCQRGCRLQNRFCKHCTDCTRVLLPGGMSTTDLPGMGAPPAFSRALYLFRSSLSSWMAFSSSLNISRLLFFFSFCFLTPGLSGLLEDASWAACKKSQPINNQCLCHVISLDQSQANIFTFLAASSTAFFVLKDSASSASLLVGL